MPIFSPRVAWTLIGVSAMLCIAASIMTVSSERVEESGRVKIRFMLNEVFLLEAMEQPEGVDSIPAMDPKVTESIERARTEMVKQGEELLSSLPSNTPDRNVLVVALRTLDRKAELLPNPLPVGLPPWLEQRARAVRGGVDDAQSRSLAHRRLAQWSILGFFLLMTAVFGLLALVLSPQIFSVSIFRESPLQQLSVLQGFAVIALWTVGRILWDSSVVRVYEASGSAKLAIHYLPPAIFAVMLLAYALRRVRGGWPDLGFVRPSSRRETGAWCLFSYVGLALALPICFVAGWLSSTIFPAQPEDVEPLLPLVWDTFGEGRGWLLFLVAAGVAPFVEALLFRGFLYTVLRERLGATGANVVQALTFAFLHCAPSKFLVLFALGTVLGMLRERTGSIFSSIVLHALWNGGTLMEFAFLFGA